MNCVNTYKSSEIAVANGEVVITVAGVDFATMSNLSEFNLILCQNFPPAAGTDQVVLSDGTNTVPVYVVTGNYLHADQIRCRRRYRLVFGNNPVHASLVCRVHRTAFVPAAAPAPTVQTVKIKKEAV